MKAHEIKSHPGNERLIPENETERALFRLALSGAMPRRARIALGPQPETHFRLSANVFLRLTDEWNEHGELKVLGKGDVEYSQSGREADREWLMTEPAVFWYSLARKGDGRVVVMRRMESAGKPGPEVLEAGHA